MSNRIAVPLTHPVPVIAIEDDRLAGPVYHPGVPNEKAWQAGNAAASQYQAVYLVWTNLIAYLSEAKQASGLVAKLHLKSALCELKTLIDIVPALHHCIMQQPTYDKPGLRPFIALSLEEKRLAGVSYKLYNQARSRVLSKVQDIRNGIGAHHADPIVHREGPRPKVKSRAGLRERLTWGEITELWQLLELKQFSEVLSSLQEYLRFANDLPIYEWYRFENDGTVRTLLPMTGAFQEGGGEATMQMMGPELMAKLGIFRARPEPQKA